MSEVSTTSPHSPLLWDGVCWPHAGGVLLAGGMDAFFVPRAAAFFLSYPGLEWSEGPQLPRAMTGQFAANLGAMGRPMLWGGFGLGYFKDVLVLVDGEWDELGEELEHSRVSGVSVMVPSDLWQSCE